MTALIPRLADQKDAPAMTELVDSPDRETIASPLPRVELQIMRGRAKNKIRRVEVPVFLIGSATDCDLVLADAAFPEVHTYLYVNRGGVSVRRLGEGPELAVDGREVQASPVADGQTLRVGSYEFAVRIQQPVAPPPTKRSSDDHRPTNKAVVSRWSDRDPEAVALVRALLDDIRTALRVESSLKLYVEQESPWQAITAGESLSVRKATA
jgi:hypothetical protein